MQYVMVAIVAAGLSLVCGQIWLRRRRVTPLRREIRARNITFRAALDRVYVIEPGTSPGSDFEVPISSPVELIIRGDAFEVSSARPFGRVMGLEYFFMARETSVELNRPIPGSTGRIRRLGSSCAAGRAVRKSSSRSGRRMIFSTSGMLLRLLAQFPTSRGSPLVMRRSLGLTRTRTPSCQPSCATADDVPVACPIGRSKRGTHGHSRTA
jgi:hypothetical protein